MAQAVERNESVHPILSPDESYALFDHEARRLMGISGKEFMERWDSGELAEIADEPGRRHIMRLALMMPRDSYRPC